jgi:hypothetical protein
MRSPRIRRLSDRPAAMSPYDAASYGLVCIGGADMEAHASTSKSLLVIAPDVEPTAGKLTGPKLPIDSDFKKNAVAMVRVPCARLYPYSLDGACPSVPIFTRLNPPEPALRVPSVHPLCRPARSSPRSTRWRRRELSHGTRVGVRVRVRVRVRVSKTRWRPQTGMVSTILGN